MVIYAMESNNQGLTLSIVCMYLVEIIGPLFNRSKFNFSAMLLILFGTY
jgi:hypothetical protein